ncbi:MAG TPA: DNA-3-methyladenine glycosylase [Gemmatimonadota bacterium]|nr:DNA-3-methyladenine glycosylase [Gemmatimonadota bacterium]
MSPGETRRGTRSAERLSRDFFTRDTLTVARELLGCALVHAGPAGRVSGRIVEVEAYHGEDDPACHAAAGRTDRTAPLYGPPGFSYVYLIYGMYHCLNVVTRAEGEPSAVLIRAIEPLEGVAIMRARRLARRTDGRSRIPDHDLANGPGKLCQALGVTLAHNRLDLTRGSRLWIERAGNRSMGVVWSPRVGINVGSERLWRCFLEGSPYVSPSHLNRRTAIRPRPALD